MYDLQNEFVVIDYVKEENLNDNRTYPPIYYAIKNNDLELVRELLQNDIDINEKFGYVEENLLHITENIEIEKELLKHGADINSRNRYGETPLHSAVRRKKSIVFIKELLRNGAEVNTLDTVDCTPLHTIVDSFKNGANWTRDLNVIKELIKFGANYDNKCGHLLLPIFFNFRGGDGKKYAESIIKSFALKLFAVGKPELLNFCDHFRKLSEFNQRCISELEKMRSHYVSNHLTLYEYISIENPSDRLVKTINLINILESSIEYPLFCDFILDKNVFCLERSHLLTQINGIIIFSSDNVKEIVLNNDIVRIIVDFLPNDDLMNFIACCD